ncbi:MAG TPA: four helix bundle protein [Anaerolineae bacterium]|jgi:four helix bundle protein|nr:four helix bundle protein [Anaerolineae bacterium]
MEEMPMEQWVETLPKELKADPLWQSAYYRVAMYLYDLVWMDADILHKDYRTREIVSQIVRSAGSICANMEEAYGRGIGTADYVRIMRISLGEARETQGWYFRARHVLPKDLMERRSRILTQVISLLVTAIDGTKKTLRKSKN